MARIVKTEMHHTGLCPRSIERQPEGIRCHRKQATIRAGQRFQDFDRARREPDDVVDDFVGAAAVLDATQERRLAIKINIVPRKAQKAAAPRAGFKAEFDKGAKPRIARIAASLQQRLTLLQAEPDIALIIYGGAFNVLGIDRVDQQTECRLR